MSHLSSLLHFFLRHEWSQHGKTVCPPSFLSHFPSFTIYSIKSVNEWSLQLFISSSYLNSLTAPPPPPHCLFSLCLGGAGGGVGWGAGICMSSLQVCELFAMAWFSELLSLVYPEADWLVFCLKSLSDDFPVNSLNSLSFQVHICSGSGNWLNQTIRLIPRTLEMVMELITHPNRKRKAPLTSTLSLEASPCQQFRNL